MDLYRVYFLSILTFLGATSSSALYVAGDLGIIGGRKVSIEEAPYMAALLKTKDFKSFYANCGASIIHERFVLTAAHCIITNNTITKDFKLVQVGSKHLGSPDGTYIVVNKCICHQKYSQTQNKVINDICLLKLSSPMEFGKKIAPIKLPDKSFELGYGTLVNVTGWGAVKDDNLTDITSVLELRQTTVPVLSREDCSKVRSLWNDTLICAWSLGHSSCKGDSGGPLTYNDVQIGVTSFGFSNETQTLCRDLPAVYTKVANYIDWINTTIAENL